jgi:aminocarboxymuconate-semialdehyde decarboxylase
VIVDVHGHITHPALFERFPMPRTLLDIEGMLERKAALGIDLTIVGSPVGFGTMSRVPGLDNYAQPLDQLKSFHEWLAETVVKHRPRLAAYAYTNPFGGDAMLEQTAAGVRDLGFVGLIVNTSVRGEYLDSERADDFFAFAAELDVPIVLHPPAEPVGSDAISDFRLVEQVGRFLDVTMCLATLVFSGRLEQYPGLRFVAVTAGGAIGLLAGRLDQAYQPRHWGGPAAGEGKGPPSGPPAAPPMLQYENKIGSAPSTFLKQLYVDTANSSLANHLANLELMGSGHMLFGTDSPPLATPLEAGIELVERLPVPDEEKRKIFSENALRLFKLDGSAAQKRDVEVPAPVREP